MRNFVFTINNYTDADLGGLYGLSSLKMCRYLVFGKEVGEQGTPHIQGYCELSVSKTPQQLHKHLPRGYFEPRRGTPQQAAEYCKKDGNFEEFGTISAQGHREDLNFLVQSISDEPNIYRIMEDFPTLYLKYPKAIESMVTYHRSRSTAEHLAATMPVNLYLWQQWLLEELEKQPHPRKVLWYWEDIGNTGKSHMTKYLMLNKSSYVVTGGTKADIFYAYQDQQIIIFDLSRDCQDKLYIYDVIENFKNGQFLSTKYMSAMRMFPTPHVVVFANFEPDRSRLSEDRWDIHHIVRMECV